MKTFLAQRPRTGILRASSGRLAMAGLATAAILLSAGPAQATITYDTGLSGPGTYYGTGNPNTNWVVDNANGVEIGLQTLIRYTGSVAPSPASSSIYYVPTGATTVSGKTGSAWGFAFSLNLKNAGLTLSDVTTSLQLTDVANGTTGSFDALGIPDNYGYSDSGRDGGDGTALSSTDWGFQNAETLSWASIAGALNDSGFDMNQNDTYKFMFSVARKCTAEVCTSSSEPLAMVQSTVIAGNGAPASVPEPASIGLFGIGLLALLGLAGRRRAAGTPGV